jgi:LacI family transcriptional regulator
LRDLLAKLKIALQKMRITDQKTKRRKTGGVRIDDVAAEAGVSAMTVSRVVNANARVSQATRDKVNAAIEALRYVPNVAARRLAAGESVSIGLVFDNPSAAFFAELLIGALEECSAAGARLLLERGGDPQSDMAAVHRLLASGMNGLLLPPPMSDSREILTYVQAENIPIVALWTTSLPPHGAGVGIDDFEAARQMTSLLIQRGHKRIGFIKGASNQSSSHYRFEGYLAALKHADIPADEALVTSGAFTFQSGLSCARQLLEQLHPPTAIFACNDDMAVAVVSVAQRMRMDIPKDLSIVGFDDTPLAVTVMPELTTVRQPTIAMARWAVTQLVSDIRRRREGLVVAQRYQRLDFELIQRASVGLPRAS